MKKPTLGKIVFLCLVIVSKLSIASTSNFNAPVKASQYCAFLNQNAASDPNHLFDEKMESDPNAACIVRLGSPGKYSYEVIARRENFPVTYVNSCNEKNYSDCFQESFEEDAVSADDLLKSNFSDFTINVSSLPTLTLVTAPIPSSISSVSEAVSLVGLLAFGAAFVTLGDFRQALADPANARAESLGIVRQGESEIIRPQTTRNRAQNLNIHTQLITALQSEHSLEEAQAFVGAEISPLNLISESSSRLSRERLQRIIAAADAERARRTGTLSTAVIVPDPTTSTPIEVKNSNKKIEAKAAKSFWLEQRVKAATADISSMTVEQAKEEASRAANVAAQWYERNQNLEIDEPGNILELYQLFEAVAQEAEKTERVWNARATTIARIDELIGNASAQRAASEAKNKAEEAQAEADSIEYKNINKLLHSKERQTTKEKKRAAERRAEDLKAQAEEANRWASLSRSERKAELVVKVPRISEKESQIFSNTHFSDATIAWDHADSSWAATLLAKDEAIAAREASTIAAEIAKAKKADFEAKKAWFDKVNTWVQSSNMDPKISTVFAAAESGVHLAQTLYNAAWDYSVQAAAKAAATADINAKKTPLIAHEEELRARRIEFAAWDTDMLEAAALANDIFFEDAWAARVAESDRMAESTESSWISRHLDLYDKKEAITAHSKIMQTIAHDKAEDVKKKDAEKKEAEQLQDAVIAQYDATRRETFKAIDRAKAANETWNDAYQDWTKAVEIVAEAQEKAAEATRVLEDTDRIALRAIYRTQAIAITDWKTWVNTWPEAMMRLEAIADKAQADFDEATLEVTTARKKATKASHLAENSSSVAASAHAIADWLSFEAARAVEAEAALRNENRSWLDFSSSDKAWAVALRESFKRPVDAISTVMREKEAEQRIKINQQLDQIRQCRDQLNREINKLEDSINEAMNSSNELEDALNAEMNSLNELEDALSRKIGQIRKIAILNSDVNSEELDKEIIEELDKEVIKARTDKQELDKKIIKARTDKEELDKKIIEVRRTHQQDGRKILSSLEQEIQKIESKAMPWMPWYDQINIAAKIADKNRTQAHHTQLKALENESIAKKELEQAEAKAAHYAIIYQEALKKLSQASKKIGTKLEEAFNHAEEMEVYLAKKMLDEACDKIEQHDIKYEAAVQNNHDSDDKFQHLKNEEQIVKKEVSEATKGVKTSEATEPSLTEQAKNLLQAVHSIKNFKNRDVISHLLLEDGKKDLPVSNALVIKEKEIEGYWNNLITYTQQGAAHSYAVVRGHHLSQQEDLSSGSSGEVAAQKINPILAIKEARLKRLQKLLQLAEEELTRAEAIVNEAAHKKTTAQFEYIQAMMNQIIAKATVIMSKMNMASTDDLSLHPDIEHSVIRHLSTIKENANSFSSEAALIAQENKTLMLENGGRFEKQAARYEEEASDAKSHSKNIKKQWEDTNILKRWRDAALAAEKKWSAEIADAAQEVADQSKKTHIKVSSSLTPFEQKSDDLKQESDALHTTVETMNSSLAQNESISNRAAIIHALTTIADQATSVRSTTQAAQMTQEQLMHHAVRQTARVETKKALKARVERYAADDKTRPPQPSWLSQFFMNADEKAAVIKKSADHEKIVADAKEKESKVSDAAIKAIAEAKARKKTKLTESQQNTSEESKLDDLSSEVQHVSRNSIDRMKSF